MSGLLHLGYICFFSLIVYVLLFESFLVQRWPVSDRQPLLFLYLVQSLGVELCKLSLQASKILVFIKCNRASQDIDTFLILKKNWPVPKPIWIAIKTIYLNLHLRYLDKIWFANRLCPSEGSDINRYETGSSIHRRGRHLEKWIWRHISAVGVSIWTKFGIAYCRITCRYRANGRNRK